MKKIRIAKIQGAKGINNLYINGHLVTDGNFEIKDPTYYQCLVILQSRINKLIQEMDDEI